MTQDKKKNGETRRQTKKKWGDEMHDKKIMGRRDTKQKRGDKTQDE